MSQRSLTNGERPKVNRDKAVQIANVLRHYRHVHKVLLFGSVARQGWGIDLDLIIITDHGRASDFIAIAAEAMRDFEIMKNRRLRIGLPARNGIYSHKRLRLYAAAKALGDNFFSLCTQAKLLASHAELDIFVFPPDWLDHLRVLQAALPHSDPMFMENIARDAISIA